jgi:hypothetical protein
MVFTQLTAKPVAVAEAEVVLVAEVDQVAMDVLAEAVEEVMAIMS